MDNKKRTMAFDLIGDDEYSATIHLDRDCGIAELVGEEGYDTVHEGFQEIMDFVAIKLIPETIENVRKHPRMWSKDVRDFVELIDPKEDEG